MADPLRVPVALLGEEIEAPVVRSARLRSKDHLPRTHSPEPAPSRSAHRKRADANLRRDSWPRQASPR